MHLGDAHPRSCSPDVWVLMFELSKGHATPPTHCPSQVGDHSTMPISPRHRAPPCCRPSTTLRQAEELHRRALTGREGQLGPVHPDTLSSVCEMAVLLEAKGSFAEARGISVGIVLLGGSAWIREMWQVGSQFSWPGVRGITSQYRHCPRCIIVIIILIMASLASLLGFISVVLKLSRPTARAPSFRVLMWMSMFDGRYMVYRYLRNAQSTGIPNPA